jgi:uncharacterized protein YjbI with pentapeptide repeats
MKVQNYTQLPFGTKVTSRKPPQREMTVVIRGRYRLGPGQAVVPVGDFAEQGTLSGDRFAEGDDEHTGECIHPSDFADFKLGTEVMLRGTCHAPGGRPVTACNVRFGIGSWSKTLLVVGRRVWSERLLGAASFSEPEPFTRMLLGYQNAFGGPGHAPNPVGKGLRGPELPNVELPSALIRSRGDRPPPAGFGPLNPAWPQRRGKLGEAYGEAWRKTRYPFYAEDFDWSSFHAAPKDQQLGRYVRGDEDLWFENLHPVARSFSVRLPGLRMRAFVRTAAPDILEAPMRLDTILADLDAGTLSLTWRGLVPVREDDLADVETLLVSYEQLVDEPYPTAHYHGLVEAFEADPAGRDRLLSPEMKKAIAEAQASKEADPGESPVDAVAGSMRAASTSASPDVRSSAVETMGQARGALSHLEALKAQAAANGNAAPAASPAATVAEQAQKGLGALRQLRERLAQTGGPPDRIAGADALLNNPHLQGLMLPSPEVEPAPGADLSNRDLNGRDLRGRDLSGANLSGAQLLRAKLGGARLVGANLRGAMLAEADLEGADLSAADLTKAAFFGAKLKGATLDRARLDGAIFEGADLSDASLAEARGDRIVFASARLCKVLARAAHFTHAISVKGDLTDADFRGSTLHGCSFFMAKAQRILLAGADIYGTNFSDSDVSNADVQEARADRTTWRMAKVEGADFRWAQLTDARFDEASAKGARFSAANLRGASFYRASLDDCELIEADLLGANLRKASLTRASFKGANLYSAILLDAGGKDVIFDRANLERVVRQG